jgi:hypothetical protein
VLGLSYVATAVNVIDRAAASRALAAFRTSIAFGWRAGAADSAAACGPFAEECFFVAEVATPSAARSAPNATARAARTLAIIVARG